MTSFQITEDLLAQEKAWLPTDVDVDSESNDSDLSSEEEFSPAESEESIQGPSTGFSERGPANKDCDVAPKKDKKDKNTVPPIAPPRKTPRPPPKNKPNPDNYPTGQTKQAKSK